MKLLKINKLYDSDRGIQFGCGNLPGGFEFSCGAHSKYSISVESSDRDKLCVTFRRWIRQLGGYVCGHGYDPDKPVVYFSVVIPANVVIDGLELPALELV